MKDLIAGSLGRLDDAGGSSMFAVPRTIYVPPEYEVETDVPGVAEFVTCSLDGRLWIWKRSRRYYVAAFRWNEETEQLEFVSTTILNGETVIKRGVDWILTDKSLILSLDGEPYISRTEYDSDDTTYIDNINQSYSFCPELETWQEICTTHKLNIEESPSNKWETILLRTTSVVPLELYYDVEGIKAITNIPPQLIYFNGQLYGKGKANIGRVYLLPQRINSNGEPSNFYMFTCPDYIRQYDTQNDMFNDNDDWDKLLLAPLNDVSVCIFTPDSDDYEACKKAKDGQVYLLPQQEQYNYSDNNESIFFDSITHSNLLLSDKETSLPYDNLLYNCKGFNQWLAPTEEIKTICPQIISSSYNNISLICFLQEKFYRVYCQGQNLVFLTENNIALAWHNEKNRKKINVYNTSTNFNIFEYQNIGSWDKIYNEFIEIEPINYIEGINERLLNTGIIIISEKTDFYYISCYNTGDLVEFSLSRYGGMSVASWLCTLREAEYKILIFHPEDGTFQINSYTLSGNGVCYGDILPISGNYSYYFSDFFEYIPNVSSIGITLKECYYKGHETDKTGDGTYLDSYKELIYSNETLMYDFSQFYTSPWHLFSQTNTSIKYCFYIKYISDYICTFCEKFTGIEFSIDMRVLFPNFTKSYARNIINFYSDTGAIQDIYGNTIPIEYRYIIQTPDYNLFVIKIKFTQILLDILSKITILEK